MATINLGSIKFNWKGAYAGGTAYTVDDVVSSGGSSYVCILASTGNATSNGTYWEQMSSAGTNGTDGTDVGTTLTTQGDILYRDGSGLQRLAKGTGGQALLMNSGATAPEWGSGGKGIKHSYYENSMRSTSYHNITSRTAFWDLTFTKHYINSMLLISGMFPYSTEGAQYPHCGIVGTRLSTTGYDSNGSDQNARWGYSSGANDTDLAQTTTGTWYYDSTSTNISGTGTIYMRNYVSSASGSTVSGFKVYNPKSSDDARGFDTYSYITITEFEI